jgi:hypothetical protein
MDLQIGMGSILPVSKLVNYLQTREFGLFALESPPLTYFHRLLLTPGLGHTKEITQLSECVGAHTSFRTFDLQSSQMNERKVKMVSSGGNRNHFLKGGILPKRFWTFIIPSSS